MTNADTTTTSTTSVETDDHTDDRSAVVDAWLVAYAEPDAARRRELIAASWATTGALFDPPFDGTGHDELSGLADVVLTHYAGHTFRRTTRIDGHHTYARYGWELVAPDGSVAVAGIDFVTFAPDGKLAHAVGFFGPLDA